MPLGGFKPPTFWVGVKLLANMATTSPLCQAYLRCQMEVKEGHKVALKQPSEQTEEDSVSKLGLQIMRFQIDLVQMLVHERHETLLDIFELC